MNAADWLLARIDGAPEDLVHTMLAVIPPEQSPVAEALARGAFTLYAQVLRGSGRREDAHPLLAADALFTHSFEAQAESDPDGLERFAERWSGTSLLDMADE